MLYELQKLNDGHVLQLFSYGMKKSRGNGIVSRSSIDQKNLVLNQTFLPFLDKLNTDYNSIESILSGAREYFINRFSQCSSNTLKKEKSFIISWLNLNFPSYRPQILKLFSEFQIPEVGIRKVDKAIDYTELSHIVSCIKNPKHKLFIKFLYYSGARVSEMLHLRIRDGKLSRDKTEIFFKTHGKGNKDRAIRIKRSIYEEILNVFDSKSRFNTNGYLFFNKHSVNQYYTRNNILKITYKYGNFSCHNLRHSRATNLIEEGVSLNSVSEFLGHSSVLTTAKFYLFNTAKPDQLMRNIL